LNSTHGTFIGSLRLEGSKPQQVFIDSELRFGASTRSYIIRERPQINKHFPSILQSNNNSNANESLNESGEEKQDQNSLNVSILPESEAELDNLTDFHTAHNKRIAHLVDVNSANSNNSANIMGVGPVMVKKKKKTVMFNDEEDVINPEDVDPSIGRFRNMIQTVVVIPKKKKRPSQVEFQNEFQPSVNFKRSKQPLYENDSSSKFADQEEEDEPSSKISDTKNTSHEDSRNQSSTLYDNDDYDTSSFSTMGIKKLDLAPDVDSYKPYSAPFQNEQFANLKRQQLKFHLEQINKQWDRDQNQQQQQEHNEFDLSSKKKYAKEAWPGRKPTHSNTTATTTVSPPISNTNPKAASKIISPSRSQEVKQNASNFKKRSPAPDGSNLAPKRLLI
jgi:nuclear inhibitor of protein phosphatase 1